MTSQRRKEANRKNAQKSTGPKTDEGKLRSSRNALKHGLTARDAVLPNEDPGAFQAQMDQWVDYYQPKDPAQLAVIERAVVSKWKLDRCTRLETERVAEKVRRAVRQYDLDRFAEAETIGRQLIYEPLNRCEIPQIHDPVVRDRIARRSAANPAILSRQLQSTSQGVQWLIDRWLELAEMLKIHGFWHYPEKYRAIWMLGKRPEDVLEDVVVQQIYLACNVAHPDCSDENPDSFDLWDECFQSKLGIQGKPMYFHQIDQIRELRPADVLTARARLWELFTNEINRLRVLQNTLIDQYDRDDRQSARERIMLDESPSGLLLRRYETVCEREMHRSIADLMKLRKAEISEPPPEPVAAEAGPEPQVEESTGVTPGSVVSRNEARAGASRPAPGSSRRSKATGAAVKPARTGAS